jgi:hypothetical protein
MNVKEMLYQISVDSVGVDNPSDLDLALFLKYLNKAYFEIFRATDKQNQLVSHVKEVLNCVDGVCSAFSRVPLSILYVNAFNVGYNLTPKAYSDIKRDHPMLDNTGLPACYYIRENLLNIYPLGGTVTDPLVITVEYTSEPDLLTIDTVESDIPFSKMFHQNIVDGAVYYLFKSDANYKNLPKATDLKVTWESSKREIATSMMNLSNNYYVSTYSRV